MGESKERPGQQYSRRDTVRRINLFFFVVFGMFCILVVKLAHVQLVQGEYMREAEQRTATRTVPIPPIRGGIFDAAGSPIASSVPTQALYFTLLPGMKAEDAEALAERLEDVFATYGDEDGMLRSDTILELMDLESNRSYAFTPRKLKYDLTKREVAYFMSHAAEYPQLEVAEESIRTYDASSIAVQLVGYLKTYDAAVQSLDFYKDKQKTDDPYTRYLGHELVGNDGLELLFQDLLRGKNGMKSIAVDATGRIAGPAVTIYPEKGADLYLTIHKQIQLETEKAIAEHLSYLRTAPFESGDRAPFARAGYAVAMEVDTGKVIAMASIPDYDPNVWRGGRIAQDEWSAIHSIVGNGAIRETYQQWESQEEANKHASSLVFLGSTQKPLTVLIGLAEGLITTDTRYRDAGAFAFGKKGTHRVSVRNDGGRNLGLLEPATALQKSSNAFMAEMIGNALYLRDGKEGVEIWDRYMKSFGLGVTTGSGLLGEQAGVAGYLAEADNASAQSALVYASFGQQGKYTALQLAQYTAVLANRGKRMKPQFAEKAVNAEGETVRTFEPAVLNEIRFPEPFWEEIEAGMKSNVQGFDGVTYTFRRKTGTSEQDVSGGRVENAVFIGYAPAEKPKVAVAVVVPEGGYGGRGAAPIARKIFDAYQAVYGF
ncbi:penicillin-binding protein 2 [Paenibacillus antri]|uniref:Penicillin-binding protein 2 n=1 Tax=Paenibacillus antri TaxID=2582848 RepID=A0A5R9GGN4_9BACL|nr:penicillin-binding transpeptidase domain-containing protein [Paenibacillus antri]TLS51903.1 penicillin-binding protein 2 [Paenibacillus antri]